MCRQKMEKRKDESFQVVTEGDLRVLSETEGPPASLYGRSAKMGSKREIVDAERVREDKIRGLTERGPKIKRKAN